jgi:hypothetical protein
MNHHEDDEQAAVFDWAAHIPILRWMFAIPNGGTRNPREAARLVRQGVKRGVSDIFLPRPIYNHRSFYAGLYIEMKRRKKDGRSRLTEHQKQFQVAMEAASYKCVVCYGADEAIEAIKKYCGI